MPDAITVRNGQLEDLLRAADAFRDLVEELTLDYDEVILVPTDCEEYFLPRVSGYPPKNTGAPRPNAR